MLLIWSVIALLILAEDIPVHRVEQVLNCDMLDTEDNVVFENQDDKAAAVSEFPSTVGVIHSFGLCC